MIPRGIKYREKVWLPGSERFITIRPLSTWEVDEVFAFVLYDIEPETAKAILKLNIDEFEEKDLDGVDPPEFILYDKMIDYNFIFAASRDFENWTFDDIKDLPYSDDLKSVADRVKEITGVSPKQRKRIIKAYLKTPQGKVVSNLVLRFYQPIADIGDITPLQLELFMDHEDEETKISVNNDDVNIVAGGIERLKEIMRKKMKNGDTR